MDDLFKLAGMKHKQGYYTPQEWEHKTGVNPLQFGDLITLTRTGLCVWSDKAEILFQSHCERVAINYSALGVRVA